ncbi:MAG: polyprenyl synthetase family protein [Acidobacteriota bacterium]
MTAAPSLHEIYGSIGPELQEVEREFERQVDSPVDVIRRASRYLMEGGGKRIRPALLLLTTRLLNFSGRLAILFAAIVELIHTATLIHDDIVDEADLRRGRASLNRRMGNDITVLMGDYLYIKSVSLAVHQKNQRILEILAEVTLRMVEGELIELAHAGRIDITEDEHLDVVRRKTAHLFSACTEIGAVISGAREDQIVKLRDYGMELGMAFQIVDDILDFTSTEKMLGKPVVNDLREGRLTLPLIYLLRKGNDEHRDAIATVLRERDYGTVSRERILSIVSQDGVIEQTRDFARKFGQSACARLAIFDDSDTKRALAALPTYILEREK